MKVCEELVDNTECVTRMDKKTGLFCEPGDPKDIAAKIKTLIVDKELRENIILSAQEMVRQQYDWGIISQKVASAYSEIKKDIQP